jgi:hypothetical protein
MGFPNVPFLTAPAAPLTRIFVPSAQQSAVSACGNYFSFPSSLGESLFMLTFTKFVLEQMGLVVNFAFTLLVPNSSQFKLSSVFTRGGK